MDGFRAARPPQQFQHLNALQQSRPMSGGVPMARGGMQGMPSMTRPPSAPPSMGSMGGFMPGPTGNAPMGGFGGNVYQRQMDIASNPNMSFGNSADVYHWMEFGGRPGYDPTHLYRPGTPRL
jgi:hypothetical protein